jgi:hypothetical protein
MKISGAFKPILYLFTISLLVLTPLSCASVETFIAHADSNAIKTLEMAQPAAINNTLKVSPDNPRYFTDATGKAILLTGSHTWMNFQDIGNTNPIQDRFDYETYLDMLVAHNHNFFRLWVWEESLSAAGQGGYWTDPLPYQRPGPGVAQDGKPKFDLTKFNQAYFDRLRERVQQAGQRGIYVSVMLFNGWSIESKDGSRDPWYGHPFNRANNINGIDGDPNRDGKGSETHTLQVPAITEIQEKYVKKVIDSVNDLDNVLYEISNESHNGSKDWHYHMIELIKSYESQLPKQHPVGMTVAFPDGNNNDLLNSPADWISPNGDIDNPPPADGKKVIIYDMDHLCGLCKNTQYIWKGFTRGMNPIFMDPYDFDVIPGNINLNDPAWEKIRKDMGYVLSYAKRMNLAAMRPNGALVSSGYALANPVATGAQYLVYLPSGGSVNVNLSAAQGQLSVEWFRPANGRTYPGDPVNGGSSLQFRAPFSGEAVLYIFDPSTDSATPQPPKTAVPTATTPVGKREVSFVPLIVR